MSLSSNSCSFNSSFDIWDRIKNLKFPKGPIYLNNIANRVEENNISASSELKFEIFSKIIVKKLMKLNLSEEAESFTKSFKTWTSIEASDGLQQPTPLNSLRVALKQVQRTVSSYLQNQAFKKSFETMLQEDRGSMTRGTPHECRTGFSRLYRDLLLQEEPVSLRDRFGEQFDALPDNKKNRIFLKAGCHTRDDLFALSFPKFFIAIRSAVSSLSNFMEIMRLTNGSLNILAVIDAVDGQWPRNAARGRLVFPEPVPAAPDAEQMAFSPVASSSTSDSFSIPLHSSSKRQEPSDGKKDQVGAKKQKED